MVKHYVALINCNGRSVPTDKIKDTLDAAKDWARFSPNSWLIAFNLSAEDWNYRIRAVLHPEDNVIVIAIDHLNRHGWVTQPIIDWFTRDHESRQGV